MFDPSLLSLRVLLWAGAGLCVLLTLLGPKLLERRRRRHPFRHSLWSPRAETLMFVGVFGAFALAFIAMRA